MKDFLKKYYTDLLLVIGYTAVAILIYVVLFESLWHLWYIDFITAVVILIAGGVGGFFYIKSVIKEKAEKEAAQAEANVESSDIKEEKVEEAPVTDTEEAPKEAEDKE